MTKSRNILGPRAVWTKENEAIVLARYPHEKTEHIAADLGMRINQIYRKAKLLGLKKTPQFMASEAACTFRRGENIGAEHRFKKGSVPPNKGVKGISYPGTEATQFKKGQRPHTWMPIGSERWTSDGYLRRKMTDTGYPPRDWVSVHILLWQQHHGAIPKGHKVVFIDRDKKNITIENLEMLSHAEMMKRNTIHNLPKELEQVIQLTGALKRRIRNHGKRCD